MTFSLAPINLTAKEESPFQASFEVGVGDMALYLKNAARLASHFGGQRHAADRP